MFGVTVAQAQFRLPEERRRRNNLIQTISGLETSERNLKGILERIEQRNNGFLRDSMNMNSRNWRGRTESGYRSRNMGEVGHLTTQYLNRVRRALEDIDQTTRRLNGELVHVNQTIIDLERIAAGGM